MTDPTRTASPDGFVRQLPGDARITPAELTEAYAVATRACDLARQEILPRFRRVSVEHKADGSPVTEADREAERVIRSVLTEAFPSDAILGEEFGEAPGRPGSTQTRPPTRQWIIDPIDGTIAFARGIPLFTTLIALLVDGEPVLGLIDLPAFNDRIGGVRGGGVFRGEQRVSVSTPGREHANASSALEDALICHGDLFCFESAGLRPLYDSLSQRVRTLRGYTDAFGHLLVLSGAADAMVDCDLNPWDAAATRLLAHEAGGECWVREREGGQKVDLIFGNAATVQSIRNLPLSALSS